MEAFVWDQRYTTGEAQIDHEHQELVRLINRLIETLSDDNARSHTPQVMQQLLVYAGQHFAHEELLMQDAGCDPRLIERHCEQHRAFVSQVQKMREDGDRPEDFQNLLEFLTSWLAVHILGTDQTSMRQVQMIRSGLSASEAYRREEEIERDPAMASMIKAMGSLYRIIAKRNNALIDLNRDLEKKVSARTESLTQLNHRLLVERKKLHLAMQQLEMTQKKLVASEERRLSEVRRNMESYLLQIIDGDPVPMLVLDAEHRITHWNRACAALTGLAAEEMLGSKQQWKAFYPQERPIMADLIIDGSLNEDFQRYYHDGFRRSGNVPDAFEAEGFFSHLGDQGRWLFFTAAPLRDPDGHIVGAIETLQDVTLRHTAEEQLRSYQSHLETLVAERTQALAAANRSLEDEHGELVQLLSKVEEAQAQLLQSEKMAAIGQLAAGVAHEINNPIGFVNSNLGTLKGYVHSLLDLIAAYEESAPPDPDGRLAQARNRADLDYLREDLPVLLQESQEGLGRVTRIVQDLKDFSRVDQAEQQYANLNEALESTLNVVRNELKYKANVVLELGDIPPVYCSPAQINQVFMNLLVNAAHAIPERGTVTVRSGLENNHVWFEVEDNGVGMSKEVQRRVFEPFFTTKPIGKGTGLGLSISYDIVVKRHHGCFDVQSEEGKGTRFRIWLPLVNGHI